MTQIDAAAATSLPREKMEKYEVSSVVRGFHVYQRSWSPSLEEQLACLREDGNDKDRYAVAVLRHGRVVGHIPRRISAACSLFIERNGRIHCRITGTRQYSADLPQGGLEIPCVLTFEGDKKEVTKVRKLINKQVEAIDRKPDIQPSFKKRKIDFCITETYGQSETHRSTPWLTLNNIDLSSADKDILTAGDELTDMHINFAQAILKKQFPELSGLHSTLLIPRYSIASSPALQILHCGGNHWCVVTSIGCSAGQVKVYDSLYTSIDQVTLNLISRLFGSNTQVKLAQGPKQLGVKDCGAFAIAIATLLANGGNPTTATFNQQAMRPHLIKTFENLHLETFPDN